MALQCGEQLGRRSRAQFFGPAPGLVDRQPLPAVVQLVGLRQQEVQLAGRMTDSVGAMFDILVSRPVRSIHKEVPVHTRSIPTSSKAHGGTVRVSTSAVNEAALVPVHPSRFQVLGVDHDVSIKDFVLTNGLTFKTGRGFYEFTKTVEVQKYKEVVLVNASSGAMWSGHEARTLLGLPDDKTVNLRPGSLPGYTAFIQSTSVNRKLLGGTKFLYEVSDTPS